MSQTDRMDDVQDHITMESRNVIIRFISDNMTEHDYERMNDLNDGHKFESYEQFVEHNIKCVNDADDRDVTFMSLLALKTIRSNIKLCDKENFIEWQSDGFYFNIDGHLVITHPR